MRFETQLIKLSGLYGYLFNPTFKTDVYQWPYYRLSFLCPPLCIQNGLNALHLASKEGHVEMVAQLIKLGATVDAATKVGSRSAMGKSTSY